MVEGESEGLAYAGMRYSPATRCLDSPWAGRGREGCGARVVADGGGLTRWRRSRW